MKERKRDRLCLKEDQTGVHYQILAQGEKMEITFDFALMQITLMIEVGLFVQHITTTYTLILINQFSHTRGVITNDDKRNVERFSGKYTQTLSTILTAT